uniref:Uncharacterized protein n=1 Tax=Myoviridae sp. ctwwN25 TaxID=2825209 RepID=A0A8S5PPX1_9CAUD|nr:MAG TPA: hypothetical protein [Myoviridae sp. ctwwN25]DAR38477.1 MAG TPA: hypothetical protein [Caudoviricetes sp.]
MSKSFLQRINFLWRFLYIKQVSKRLILFGLCKPSL